MEAKSEQEVKNKSVFSTLRNENVNEYTEKKNGLTYLSWSKAWDVVKTNFEDASYKVRYFDGKPYLEDKVLGYIVATEVTINGETLEMHLPVMDGANQAQKSEPYTYKVKKYEWNPETRKKEFLGNYDEKRVDAATMFDINTAIMRCLTKNLAMFGLGLYVYQGEDLPKEIVSVEEQEQKAKEHEQAIDELLAQCKSVAELQECWTAHPDLQKDAYFKARVIKLKSELK